MEDTTAQVCWADLPEGSFLKAGDVTVEVTAGGRPGAFTFEGLPPATQLELTVTTPGGHSDSVVGFRTLASPPGDVLCRFATVNDLHLGEGRFGLMRTMRYRSEASGDGYPTVCARAAVEEALAWGAEALLVKGDLTYKGRQGQWDEAGKLLSGLPVPIHVVLGNHDVVKKSVDGRAALALHGITVPDEPFTRELPGITVALAHTAVDARSGGAVHPAQRHRLAELLEAAPGPAFLAMHHYPQRFRLPYFYPRGIPGDQAGALLDAVAAANPATLVSSGHSHRHRRRRHGPLVVSEVGATMHYPGTWAGYAVHEGGIRQVVRRVAAPEAIAWTERTRRAVLGVWGLWSPGRLQDRCFSHSWPPR